MAVITSDNPLAVHLQSLVDFAGVNRLLEQICCPAQCRMAAGFSEGELGPRNRVNVLTTDACIRIWSALRHDPVYGDLMIALKNNLRNHQVPNPVWYSAYHDLTALNVASNAAVRKGLARRTLTDDEASDWLALL